MKKLIMLSTNEIKEMTFEEVYNQYKRLIQSSVKRWKLTYEEEDLHQIASLGLWKAYKIYDVSKGNVFMTLAQIMVQGQLSKHHRDIKKHIKPISLNEVVRCGNGDNKDTTLEDNIPGSLDFAEEVVSNLYLKELLENVNKTDKSILLDYYINGMKQNEIAKKYNQNQIYISRHITKSLKKLRKIC